jgi:flagellar hook-associated protein 3 FlgL
MRKLAMVYTLIAKIGIEGLSTDARQAVIGKAADLIGQAIDGLTGIQVDLGRAQNRVKEATERLTAQQTIIDQQISSTEGVDPADAKVRIDMLTTQIEMSYSLTAKLLQMSILNYA